MYRVVFFLKNLFFLKPPLEVRLSFFPFFLLKILCVACGSKAHHLKTERMMNFIIKTHRMGTIYTKPHLFVLNKGMNSGKPQKEPFTNSFAVIFQNEEDCESLFFIAFSLWKTNFWHQHLVGSVIPFLRLPDFKKEFSPKASLMMVEHEEHQKNVAALKLLEQKEKQFHENINLISDLRRAIVYRYCRK